jgi:hypothetical protein
MRKSIKPMKVLDLLKTEKQWIKYYLGKTKAGEHVAGNHPDAVKWCLLGAIQKCYTGLQVKPSRYEWAVNRLMKAIRALHPEYRKITFTSSIIPDFNNIHTTTFRRIRRVLKKANV